MGVSLWELVYKQFMSERVPFLSRFSIQIKFLLLALGIIALCGFVVGSQLIGEMRQLIFEQIKETDGKRIKQAADNFLTDDFFAAGVAHYSAFADFLAAAKDDQTVRISVTDEKGKILYSDGLSLVGTDLSGQVDWQRAMAGATTINVGQSNVFGSTFRVAPALAKLYVPLVKSGTQTPAGVAEIYYSLSEFDDIVKKSQWIIWGVIISGMTALFMVFAVFLRFFILRPIHQLNKTVSTGDLTDIKPIIGDEIAMLTRSIVNMKQTASKSSYVLERRVKERINQLQNLADELEKEKNEYEESNRELTETKKAILNILEDVEEAKEEVSQEKIRLEGILRSIGEGVYVVDAVNRIVLFNQQAEKMLAFKESEVLNSSADKIFNAYDDKGRIQIKNGQSVINEIWKSGRADVIRNVELARKDGVRFPVILSVAPILRKGEIAGGIVAFRDVSLEKEIDAMKSEFVSVASHQLRTPLSAIKWFLEMLLAGDAGAITDAQKEFLDKAYESNERMIKLVNDLLNVSRMESGKIKFEPKPTHIEELFQSVISELTPLTRARNITVQSAFADANLPEVLVDPDKLRQVIMNLVSNALKYTNGRGKVELFYEKHPTEIICHIRDNGIGIPKDQQHKVFNKFFRADNVLKVQTEGSGLGLYIARAIIESSGGRMWFASAEGKGTTFSFGLPIHSTGKA